MVGTGIVVVLALWIPRLLWEEIVRFGRQAAVGPVPVGTLAAGYLGVAFIGSYIGSVGGFNQSRVGVVGPLVRTSISPTSISLGRFVTRTAEGAVWLLPTTTVLLAGMAVGAGGPFVPALICLGAVPLLALGIVAGRLVGTVARYVNQRLQVSLWVRAIVLVGSMIGIFLGTQAVLRYVFEPEQLLESGAVGAVLPGAPMQAYSSLVLTPVGYPGVPLGVAVAMGITIVVPVGFLAAIKLDRVLLVRDVGKDTSPNNVEGTHGIPRVFDITQSGRVAWRYLLRTRRDPRTLAHLTPVLFGVLGMSGTALDDPQLLVALAPPAAVVAGAIIAGGAFCLNPLGDDREQLPLLLTSSASVTPLLRGRMVAGIVLGLVISIGIGAPLGLLEHSPAFVLGQSLLGIGFVVAAAGIALGIGAAVPKYERREYMNVERAHPSLSITLGFFFAWLIAGGIGFGLLSVTLSGQLTGGSLILLGYVAVLLIFGVGGYTYAGHRFRQLTLDRK